MNLFEYASRKKLRFETKIGNIFTEDLWDLPLTTTEDGSLSLDDVARSMSKALKETEEESFVAKKTAEDTAASVRLDIVKRIIEYKLDYVSRAEKAALTKAKKAQILDIISKKESESLEGQSIDDLKKLLDEM